MKWDVESIERVDGPGIPCAGDKIYVKASGGYFMEFDQKTSKATGQRQVFILNADLSLTPFHVKP